MNKLYVLLTVIVCGAAIIIGNLHWNHKISAKAEKTVAEKEVEQVSPVEEETSSEKKAIDVTALSANLPKELQEKIKNAVNTKKPLQFIIYGSDSTATDKEAWPELFKKQLTTSYGEGIFNITVLSEGTKTSREVVDEKSYEQVSNAKPDIILYEPPMLKDNESVIGIENTLKNIETMMDAWKEVNEDVTIFIQPSNPLYNANFYPKQVNQLKDYTETNDIVYLNHWENWPELDDEKMEDYLADMGEQPSLPNQSGHKVWADYLTKYFIGK